MKVKVYVAIRGSLGATVFVNGKRYVHLRLQDGFTFDRDYLGPEIVRADGMEFHPSPSDWEHAKFWDHVGRLVAPPAWASLGR